MRRRSRNRTIPSSTRNAAAGWAKVAVPTAMAAAPAIRNSSASRPDATPPNAPKTGRRYPVCRMVLPPAAAVDLINKMQQVGSALAQAGVLKVNPPPAKK